MTPQQLLLALVLAAHPPELALRPQPGDTHETVDERRVRLESIASDAWHVARIDPPLPGFSREDTALAILAVARVESDFALDVDSGNCAPKRCDNNRAIGIMQVHARDVEEEASLRGSRINVLRAGLARMRGSIRACSARGAALALYTGPSCEAPEALEGSALRLGEIRMWQQRRVRIGGH